MNRASEVENKNRASARGTIFRATGRGVKNPPEECSASARLPFFVRPQVLPDVFWGAEPRQLGPMTLLEHTIAERLADVLTRQRAVEDEHLLLHGTGEHLPRGTIRAVG